MDKDIEKILFTNEEIKTAVQKLGKKALKFSDLEQKLAELDDQLNQPES